MDILLGVDAVNDAFSRKRRVRVQWHKISSQPVSPILIHQVTFLRFDFYMWLTAVKENRKRVARDMSQ